MASEVSPTARALLTLELLQNRPGITGEELARRLGVTSRAARRYIAILREADIPVESLPGPGGGYRPGRGLRPPPLLFSADEALGVVMAVLDGHRQVDDANDPVANALEKLLRSLPKTVAAQADIVRRTAAAAPDESAVRPDPTVTVAIVAACADRAPVRIEYRTEKGVERTFDVEPWTVVVRRGRWYLLCLARHADEARAYRLDRMGEVTRLPGTIDVPDGLDPVAALEEHLASGWAYTVEVEIDAPLSEIAWLPRNLGRLEEIDACRTRLCGTTSNVYSYAEMLALIPSPFRVVEGDEVRRACARLGRRLLNAASAECGEDARS